MITNGYYLTGTKEMLFPLSGTTQISNYHISNIDAIMKFFTSMCNTNQIYCINCNSSCSLYTI